MSEAGNQDIMPGEPAVAPNPGGAPATHEAEDAADVLDADADGPDILVSKLRCVTWAELN
jgi:hypothetical protein